MTATDFLRYRCIVAEDKDDLVIPFDNGAKESLVELLETYHKLKLIKKEFSWFELPNI